jgi:anthranilate synthase/aminodeoxychorismate synthase-like glutamine amidotransferase
VHGQSTRVHHDGQGVFANLPNPLTAGRYHSLVVEQASLPACLEVSARTEEGVVMAIRHRSLPVVGLQFHPESILTDCGYPILAAFLRLAGLPVPAEVPTIADELQRPAAPSRSRPTGPVTF